MQQKDKRNKIIGAIKSNISRKPPSLSEKIIHSKLLRIQFFFLENMCKDSYNLENFDLKIMVYQKKISNQKSINFIEKCHFFKVVQNAKITEINVKNTNCTNFDFAVK